MSAFSRILGAALAATVLGTGLLAGTVFADSTPASSTAPAVTAPTDHQNKIAIDALRDVLSTMVSRGVLTATQRDAIVDAARRADWDGYSIERLGDILSVLVPKTISAAERDAVLAAVRRSDHVLFRFAEVLDRLTDRGVLSRDQHDAIIDALHRADWDGFSIERLGDILGGLVQRGVINRAQRDVILAGMRR